MNELTLLTDLYQLTMVAGYFQEGKARQMANFDWFFRTLPFGGGFCVVAGLDQLIDYILNLRFEDSHLEALDSLGIFSKEILRKFERFRFTGDLLAIPEGTVVFPHETLIRVTAPLPEAQILETTLLNIMNYQTLIATKAARVCLAAEGDPVIEFGMRRAQGPNGAISAARAAFIGGCESTSNVQAGLMFDIPVKGTHAHSWVESFPDELESFRAYARTFPDSCILLVDTYDTLKSGVPNAIEAARELERRGHRFLGIRLDSGDLAYLSKKAREMLDRAGLSHAKIVASSELDEWIIESLKKQGARIDIWGVGTRLVTCWDHPALGGVYKLTAIEENGQMTPKIKVSGDPEKITNPGRNKVVRILNHNMVMQGDILLREDETVDGSHPITGCHPMYPHICKTYRPPFEPQELLVPVFLNGELVYERPSLREIQANTFRNLERLEPEYKRLTNPHIYKVSLSEKLNRVKERLLLMHQ
ncbi:MAG: nicotinate phosphoribosyltransferase [Deltaproteobacteria bacterium]|nr:nicotinate phosphoribosyltransferase [Deltaproteobacteria bacterium]MBW2121411.1 nicotinate phosphoribosyltransferase [Deltaproteobacteria bacterium]